MKKFLLFLLIFSGILSTESNASIKLTCPNGGEKFVIGSDTLITWEGILPTDTVKLEYSINNGANWKLITDKAVGLKYVWKNIPKPASNSCLVRIKPNVKGDSSRFEPVIAWQKTYGGSSHDEASSIQQTTDGGFIVAGYTESKDGDISDPKGEYDFWVLKLDKFGNLVWEKTYGGSELDIAFSIQQTTDGGYIVAGESNSNDGDVLNKQKDCISWIVKLDSLGSIEWQKSYEYDILGNSYSIQQTRDGGYIVANQYWGKYSHLILKLDAKGNIEWEKQFIDKPTNQIFKILQTPDDGYIGAGITKISNIEDPNLWVFKLDKFGNQEWDKAYGGSKAEMASFIQLTKDNGFIVSGNTNSIDGDATNNKGAVDAWVLKLDQFGTVEWQNNYGGSCNDFAACVQQTFDSGYIFAGITCSKDGDIKDSKRNWMGPFIMKISEYGLVWWEKTLYGHIGTTGYDGIADNFIIQTSDGGYVVAGSTGVDEIPGCKDTNGFSDFYIIKLGPALQSDQSDSVFSIVAPQAQANDIDMKKCLLGSAKDSLISNFVSNTGECKFRVDSIYFSGADKDAFKLTSAFPKYNLAPGENKATNIEFTPNRLGLHTAEIIIITQADTLIRNIQGMGIAKLIVSIKNDSAYAGEVKRLKLVINNLKPEVISAVATKFSAKVRFQKTILTPIKKAERTVIRDSIYMNITGTIGKTAELAQLLCVAGLGNVEETTIDIVEFALLDGNGNKVDFNIETQSGLFKLLGICREGGTRLIAPTGKAVILSIIPNPASDKVEVSVNLIEDGATNISIYNTNGIKIKEFNINEEIGQRTINIDAREFGNGLYFIQLQTPTVIENKKLMIIN